MTRLDDLSPVVVKNTTELYDLHFTCPTCGKARVQIPIRVGEPRHDPPHAWGADTLDTARMTLTPSVTNSHHGKTRCFSHVIITAGVMHRR